MEVPSFLQPQVKQQSQSVYVHSIFQHSKLLGASKTIWWPNTDPRTVVLFIPGNPGLSEFYIPFLSALYQQSSHTCILAQSHLGHTEEATAFVYDLTAQVFAAIEAFDALTQTYPAMKFIVIGHSVGSWIALQVLKARPSEVHSLFLLFPTITNILDTPNGRSFFRAFRPPFPYIISRSSLLLHPFYPRILPVLFPEWPRAQLDVLLRLLRSPSCIEACLSMAHEEMNSIRKLDINLLKTHKHRIHMHFAETDGWVGDNKDLILRSFKADIGSVKVVHGDHGIPHAFCINHSQELADQCARWMSE
ncbi:hypothetical protein J3R30DRAFT_3282318 [Lentinula aciculospora]|uniref:Uncharacterized protein n=1 Tax=Lentinula aciculospora TaxID=153920 RepID=A0A9W9ALR2_9AGAR|nr:hypothetical protein J3R30DRAFT_3282318 [Lentinula aciculospora]